MNKTNQIIWGIVGVVVIVALIYLGVTAIGPTLGENSDEPIKIGWIGPLTGDAISYGEPIKNAVVLAVEEINNSGGINGQPIKMIYEDGQCSGSGAVSAAQKLINIDKVKIIIGGVCSGETLAIAPIIEEAEVLVLSASASSPDITTAGDYIFRNNPSDDAAGKDLAQLIIKKYSKVAVISENTDFAQGNKRVFEETFKSLGGEIVISEDFNPDIKDFRSSLTKIKGSDAEALLISPQTEIAGGNIINQVKALGINLPLYGNVVLSGNKVFEIVGKNAEGMITVVLPGVSKDNPIAEEFLTKYQEKYGELTFEFYLGAAYDDVYILKQAITEVGLDTQRIKDYLYELKDYSGVIGTYGFDENGDLLGLEYDIKQVQDGQFVEYNQ